MKPDNPLVLQKPALVTTADADFYGKLRPGALVNFMLQAAVTSADNLGFGLAYLKAHGLFWVLSRFSLELYEQINWMDELQVITWPRDTDRLFYLRDFVIERKNGVKVAAATSAWLAIDQNSKRPVTLEADHSAVFTRLKDVSSGVHALDRLEMTDESPSCSESVSPVYSDFDLNGHVTTTRYIDWALNTLSFEYHENNFLKSLQVNFMKEILPNEKITLHRFDRENGFHFQGNINSDGKLAYMLTADFNSN